MSYSVVIVKYSCAVKVLLAVRLLLAFLSVEDKIGGTLAVPATSKRTAETRGQCSECQNQVSRRSPIGCKSYLFATFLLSA